MVNSQPSAQMPDAGSLDAAFGALSSPFRRESMLRLRGGPRPVGDLAHGWDLTPPAVSKHVKVLEDAGLITRERVGRLHVLSLVPERLAPADAWLADFRGFWEGSLDRLAKRLREARTPPRER